MSELEKLEADLLALPLNSRASLARALIKSLEETTDENVEALWVDEIRRRDKDLRSGKAAARPGYWRERASLKSLKLTGETFYEDCHRR